MAACFNGICFLLLLVVAVSAAIYDDTQVIVDDTPVVNLVYYPTVSRINKLKRSFGRNCILGLMNCITPKQDERYRRFMDNLEYYPKRK